MRYTKIDLEKTISVCGVDARMTNLVAKDGADLWFKQKVVTHRREIKSGEYKGCNIVAELRFDDECGNGHNTFAITATIRDPRVRRDAGFVAGGCCHEEISQHFPELAHLIKWHCVSTDSPMHYVANTMYHASDRDHNGLRKGEPSRFETRLRFAGFPIAIKANGVLTAFLKSKEGKEIYDFELVVCPMPHREKGHAGKHQFEDKYSFAGCEDKGWTYAPFDTAQDAREFAAAIKLGYSFEKIPVAFSEGKERDLNAARSCGVWPDATDEQLSADPEELKAALIERLPALMADFKKAVTEAGFYWSADSMCE